MTALFISDLHLSPAEPGVMAAFRGFLRGAARGADSLYILGDLFEYWAGDDDLADPFNAAVCADLAVLSASGVDVFFMRGNRDFLVGPAFARAAALTLLEDPVCLEIEGLPTLLMHGDTLCIDDAAYQAFRAEVRDTRWQAQFLARPLIERKHIIEGLREQSEQAKQQKSRAIMDANALAVAEAFRRSGVSRMIHGHERWVLADWCAQPAALWCNASGCQSRVIA